MNSESSNKTRIIFNAAAAIEDTAEQARYLEHACGSDSELRAEIEELLRSDREAGNFLDSPVAVLPQTIDQSCATEQPGAQIGPYKLVEEIGEGGMGAVYLATQKEPVRRKVALKVIKPGMDSKQVVSRFEAERQALAMMDHPNIARVHDGGSTESGRPYFVMELVNGIPITEYCDRYRLTNRQRLELLLDVCRAVQHAHQKGIIHRDLKPSNILVTLLDSQPIPKVIDFGIAKAVSGNLTDASLVTNFAQLVGTPLYMSPEQAELSATGVDTRSDVYSLGVLLYELLTGTTPFDRERMQSASFEEFRRIVREEEPPRPSTRVSTLDAALSTVAEKHHTDPRTLQHQIRGELDWIVMKALEKERTRRYQSANELAKDVQRYLDDKPVEACPPSKIYRFGKFARRNRVMLAASCAVLLALVVGGSLATWQAIVATQERQETERQRQIAQENFERAREAVDQYLTTVSQNQLLNSPGLQPLRKDLLELALEYYQQFIRERRDDAGLRAELAKAYSRVGLINMKIGSHEEALQAFQQGNAIFEELTNEKPSVLNRRNMAIHHYNFGLAHNALGNHDRAAQFFRRAIDVFRELVAANPDLARNRDLLASTYNDLSLLHQATGDVNEALSTIRKAIAINEKLAAENPKRRDYQHYLAGSYDTLGGLLRATGRHDEAITSVQKAIEISERIVADNPTVHQYRDWLANHFAKLSSLQQDAGRVDDALAAREKAIEIKEKLATENPDVLDYSHALAGSYNDLGNVQKDSGMQHEALTSYQKAIEISERIVGKRPEVAKYQDYLAIHYLNLGTVQTTTGDLKQAIPSFQRALAIHKSLASENPKFVRYQTGLAGSYNYLSRLQQRIGNTGEALTNCQKAIDTGERLVAANPQVLDYQWRLAGCYMDLGHLQRDTGKQHEAIGSYQKAIEISKRLMAGSPTATKYQNFLIESCIALGSLERDTDKIEEAYHLHDKAITMAKVLAEKYPAFLDYQSLLAYGCTELGSLQRDTGRRDDASESFETAINLLQKLVKEDPTRKFYRHRLARAYLERGDLQRVIEKRPEAIAAYEQAVASWAAIPKQARYVDHWSGLGEAMYRVDRWKESREALETAIGMRGEDAPTLDGGPRWWFLTMALAQLGEQERAGSYYDQLVTKMGNRPVVNKQHDRLRAEAEKLLGMEDTERTNEKTKQKMNRKVDRK